MPSRPHSHRPTPSQRRRWAKGGNHHPEAGLTGLPLSPGGGRRERRRRGGPRTPLPLVPLIAIGAGVGVAYVSQTAHATQATYQATSLSAERDALRNESDHLANELGRLRSAERIVAAAQGLGMRPAGQWVYVASSPAPVVPSPQPQMASHHVELAGGVGRVIAAFSGSFGPADTR